MDPDSIFAISAAGMNLERTRVETAALNLANAHTTAGPGGVAYRPLRVMARTVQPSFGALLAAGNSAAAIPDVRVEPMSVAPRRVHEPGHPSADAQGFVSYPGVDSVQEMVSLAEATTAYEANVAALRISRDMALKALDIGSGS